MGHVNKVSHVFTLSHVAEMLGEDEEWLFEVAEEMDTEDGQLWVVGVGEDGVMAFTDDGIENLTNLIAIHKDDPSIIEKRRHVVARQSGWEHSDNQDGHFGGRGGMMIVAARR